MSATYSQDDVAFGINTLKAFFSAWPYASGLTFGGIGGSGFMSAYSEWDVGQIGQAATIMPGGMASVTAAMTSLASSWGMTEPQTADILQGLATYAENNNLSYSFTAGITDAASSAVTEVENLPSQIGNIANFVTSPGFLILAGLIVVGVGMVLFMPEIKAGAKVATKSIGDIKKGVSQAYNDTKEGAKRVGERVGIRANPRKKTRRGKRAKA